MQIEFKKRVGIHINNTQDLLFFCDFRAIKSRLGVRHQKKQKAEISFKIPQPVTVTTVEWGSFQLSPNYTVFTSLQNFTKAVMTV